MRQSTIIGVDIGTGSTKAVAMNRTGQVLHSTQRFYAASGEANTELDPALVWQAFRQCLTEMTAALQGPPAAISLSCAMHSIMAIDAFHQPLTQAILWSDTRSTDIAQSLRETELGERLYQATGTPLHSMSLLCKIKWLQQNEPQLFSRSAKFISLKEYIWYQLFGEYVVDHSLASATGLFNVQSLQWEEPALSFAGVTPDQLSLPVPVTYTQNGLQPSLAMELGLPADTPFLVGGSDGCLANLGSGCLSPAEAAITIGTSAAVRITNPKQVHVTGQMIFNYRLDEQTFVCGGATNNGGNVFQWLLKGLFKDHADIKNYHQLFEAIASITPGSNGLLFLPYLHGERAPIWDERSSGSFVGVTASHTLLHFACAAAEGVCFALNDILSPLEEHCGAIHQLHVSGGLVQSPVMMQMLANVTGKKVVVLQTDDASAIGAVYLAQKALGWINDYSSLSKKEGKVFYPQPEAATVYRNLFPVYRSLYPVLKTSMHTLHQLTN